MTARCDDELDTLRTMYECATKLAASSDPLLKGQYLAILGRISAVMAIRQGELPRVLEDDFPVREVD